MKNSVIGLLLLAVAIGSAQAGVLSVPTPECSATFDSQPEGDHIFAPDYSTVTSPGDPAVPFTELCLVLPPDADPASVSVELVDSSTVILTDAYDIAPTPPLVAVVDGQMIYDWGDSTQIVSGRNMLVYGNNEFYPAASIQLVDVGNMRKYRIARVRYYPYRCNPVSGQVSYTSGGEIRVYYSVNSVSTATMGLPDMTFAGKVEALAANWYQARAWYPTTSQATSEAGSQAQGLTDYLIVTTQAVVDGSSKLQAFINHKFNRGFSVGVVTESQWGGGYGDTAADGIRAYLQSHYVADGIEYVLLIGNPSPTSGSVPMKMLWPRRNKGTYREAPSDYFYADLTGNWDRDGDGYYGEQDDDFGVGGIDRFPEVIVGRIPFYGNFPDLDSILQKIIDYESGGIGGAWVRRVLLTADPSDVYTPGYHLGEAITRDAATPAGFTSIRVYEEDYGLNPAPDYTPCSYTNVLSAWQQHAGFHFWWTHGNQTLAADIFTSSRAQYLDDNYPSFTFQVSCDNAYPENSNNLGYALLRRGAIGTNSATRVSWYYPGQTSFANSDSNAGMCYTYAVKLVRDHLPCGDAHFDMMLDVPNGIWMNHCVFNLYGDPSVAYAAGPMIDHEPLLDTDVTFDAYTVEADVSSNAPLAPGSPVVRWNTDGGATFDEAVMSKVGGITYRAQIPSQAFGTTVYYYIYAADTVGQNATNPAEGPYTLHSFRVRPDTAPPTIQHSPLGDTGNAAGPYPVNAIVADDVALAQVTVYYNKNGGPDIQLPMALVGEDNYQADIPGPANNGDVFSYYIVAVDNSLTGNTTREPAQAGYHSFSISDKIRVAVYNCSAKPTYFMGGNSNSYEQVVGTLNSDPAQRIDAVVVTGLTSNDLWDKQALVLPDNAPLNDDLASVTNWFGPGKVIVTMDSGTCYGAYTGWMWPAAAGANGYGGYWDYGSSMYQEIWTADAITGSYGVGEVIEARLYEAQLYTNKLPSDAVALAGKQGDATRCYAAYRDVPGRGRFVALGPYIAVCPTQESIVRNAVLLLPPATGKDIQVITPGSGENYEAGDIVAISFQTSGSWSASDRVMLEYYTGLDPTWHEIPGAGSLIYSAGTFQWDTTGLLGSHDYKVRASLVGGSVSDESDAPFTIVPTMQIAEAKGVPDGRLVKFAGKSVSYNLGSLIYIQEPDRLAGMRVDTGQIPTLSTTVDVVGVMDTVGGERALIAESVTPLGVSSQAVAYGLKTSSVGGGAFGLQDAVMEYRAPGGGLRKLLPAGGLNNIGLLIRVAGRVTDVGTDYFYLDDGADCDDGSGAIGVRVLCGSFSKPAVGHHVIVTAVSSTYFDRGNMFRALIMPSQEDLQILP